MVERHPVGDTASPVVAGDGEALVPELARRGYRPAVLSRSAEVKNEKEYADAEVIVGDATRSADVAAAGERGA